jgi:hypothetical protein
MADGSVRDEIAAALKANGYRVNTHPGIIAALLPVVERLQRQAAANELRAIGRAGLAASPGPHPVMIPVGYLFDRADALDPS